MELETRNIHKRFGPVHANNAISVNFGGGRIIGILGENGAGKSTLMKILSGFQPADEGEIWINGHHVDYTGPLAAIGQGIGMLQQDPLDVGAFTVIENFIYGSPGGIGLARGLALNKLAEITSRFGFELDPDTPIDLLSIAQRQQLEIIRLLAQGVEMLILDEPTTGISAEQKEILFDALRGLAHNDGMTILLVSHKLEDVITLCDEVIVLRAGRHVGGMPMPEITDLTDTELVNKTKSELVTLMFGQELAPETSEFFEVGEPVLALDKVTLHGKRLNVEDISLEVRAGEVIGLAGLDGSGQGLLMRGCVGLEKLSGGRVSVKGQNMTGKPYRNFMHSGVVFGAAGRLEEGLIAGLTLTEHVALVSDNKALVDWKAAAKRTEGRIETYNIYGRPDNNIEQLSGGNQQRVLMGLLPDEPVALVLEQPTRGLDVESARWIWKQLMARCETGTAIIFSSAELDELVTYSDRILVFYVGQVYEIEDARSTTIDELGHLIGGEFGERKS